MKVYRLPTTLRAKTEKSCLYHKISSDICIAYLLAIEVASNNFSYSNSYFSCTRLATTFNLMEDRPLRCV